MMTFSRWLRFLSMKLGTKIRKILIAQLPILFLIFGISHCYAVPIPVGATYGGGTVFCVSQTPDITKCVPEGAGEYGLIMAQVDQANFDSNSSHGVTWSSKYDAIPAAGSDDDGLANTAAILAALSQDNPGNNAAHLCNSLNEGPGGQVGAHLTAWYLPSKNELNKMYLFAKNNGLIGKNCAGSKAGGVQCLVGGHNATIIGYWSSSEYSGLHLGAWYQNFSAGSQGYGGKIYYSLGVRAVRAFNNLTIQQFNVLPKPEIPTKVGVTVPVPPPTAESLAAAVPVMPQVASAKAPSSLAASVPPPATIPVAAHTSADRFTLGNAAERLARLGDLPRLYPPDYQPPSLVKAIDEAGVPAAEEAYAACDDVAACAVAEGAVDGIRLTREDAASIAMYTYDCGDNSPYRIINGVLCERNVLQLRRMRGLLYRLLHALRNLQPMQPQVLFRGIRARVNLDDAHYHQGNTVTWHTFSSTSLDMQTTQDFLTDQITRRCEGTLFIIRGTPWGYNIQPFSCFPDEREILLEPEIDLRVTGIINAALIVVDLEMLPNQRLLLERFIPRNVVVVVILTPAAAEANALLQIAQNPVTDLNGLNAVVRNQNVNAQILAAVAAHRNADANTLLNIARNNITDIAGLTAIVRNPNVNDEALAIVEHHQNHNEALLSEILAMRADFAGIILGYGTKKSS